MGRPEQSNSLSGPLAQLINQKRESVPERVDDSSQLTGG